MADPTLERLYHNHKGSITSLAFQPQSSILASSSSNDTVINLSNTTLDTSRPTTLAGHKVTIMIDILGFSIRIII